MASREQAETILRQDIESAWEPYFDRTTINRTQFARRMRYAIEPVLIQQYKEAALALLQRFVKPADIDLEELDELADTEMAKWCNELGVMLAETTGRWVEDDENPGRAFSRERAELISITEITRARTAGELAAAAILEELDILLDCRWYTMLDERVCPVCGPLHKTPEKFWREIIPNGTPAHPRCLLPGTSVLASGVVAAFRAWYTGLANEIVLADGRKLSVTANHMVLTPDGFKRADAICKGDYVIDCGSLDGVSLGHPDNNLRPAKIEDMFSSLAVSSGVTASRVPVAAEYLHGDGALCHGYIDVVTVDSKLGSASEAPAQNGLQNLPLCADWGSVKLDSLSDFDSMLVRLSLAAHGVVSRLSPGLTLVGSHGGLHDEHGGGSPARNEPDRVESADEYRTGHAESLGSLLDAFSGFVSCSEVIDINRWQYNGHVYDLQTESGLHIDNGIITSNCRCRLDWRERKRPLKKVGRLRGRSRTGVATVATPDTPGRSKSMRFSRMRRTGRMQRRSRESVEDFAVLRPNTRLIESHRNPIEEAYLQDDGKWIVPEFALQEWDESVKHLSESVYDGEPRDGDGDGFVFDGTPDERPATPEEKRLGATERWALDKFKNPEHAKAFAEWFGDSKIVDENGNPLVVFHGTADEFNEFKKSTNIHTEALGVDTHFFTSNADLASSYAYQAGIGKNYKLGGEPTQTVDEYEYPNSQGDNLLSVYLKIERPLVIDAEGREWNESLSDIQDSIETYSSKPERDFKTMRAVLREKYKKEEQYGIEYDYEPDEKAKYEKLSKEWQQHIGKNRNKDEPIQGVAYYDGIVIRNTFDRPGVESPTGGTYSPYTDVFVAFNGNQIKSATANKGTFSSESTRINESDVDPKDGDGDGLVDDSKPTERPATAKEKKAEARQRKQFDPTTKSAIARASAKRVGKEVQDIGVANEYALAKQLKGEALPNSAPHDVETSTDLIEVKTVVIGENAKLTMNKYAQVRKLIQEKITKKPYHTVVYDDSKFIKTKNKADRKIYYRRGVAGSARLGSLHEVTGGIEEVKKLMAAPERSLPEGAQRTDGNLRVGSWRAIKGSKGFTNTKTGDEALPKP